MHADYLAHDRLAEARARAARQTLVAELRAQQAQTTRGWLARLAERSEDAGALGGGGRAAQEPPVTSMVTPVTKSASLRARKQMTRA